MRVAEYANSETCGVRNMWRMTGFCAVLLLLVLPSGRVWTQESDIITVTGLYVGGSEAEGDNTLHPCHVFELWAVETGSSAFTALSAAYDGADSAHLSESGGLFVAVRGRYRAYEDAYGDEGKAHAHNDGIFEITEFVRSSTAAAEITACEWTCERAYGANSPTCLAEVDGQCGNTRSSCMTGDLFDHDEADLSDTVTEYRWMCTGSYGGDSVICTAPKAGLRGDVDESPISVGPLRR